jgi:hypothetical protein
VDLDQDRDGRYIAAKLEWIDVFNLLGMSDNFLITVILRK